MLLFFKTSAFLHFTTKRTSLRPMLSARGNAINTLSYFKECSANINNDNRDISNNEINKEHNESKLSSRKCN